MGSMKLSCLVLLIAQLAAAAPQMVMENCKERCGDIMIPYPFGSGEEHCYENEWFKIDCINNTKTLLSSIRMEVLNISVGQRSDSYSRITVKGPIKLSNPNCSGVDMDIDSGLEPVINLTGSPFIFSASNKFIAVGCNSRASVTDNSTAPEIIGCNTRCSSTQSQEDLNIDWQRVFSSLYIEFSETYRPCNGTGCGFRFEIP